MTSNSHLSDNEFAELLGGNASQTVLAHLQLCPDCSVEAKSFRDALTGLRGALASATEAPRLIRGETHTHAPAVGRWGMRFAGAFTVVAMVAAGILLDRNSVLDQSSKAATVNSAKSTISDSDLLNEIQSELTSDVPAALQPAAYLADERQQILQSAQQQAGVQRR
jgi:hypothetical protein